MSELTVKSRNSETIADRVVAAELAEVAVAQAPADEELEAVADVYRKAKEAGRPTNVAVRVALDLVRDDCTGMDHEARARGFLEPAAHPRRRSQA